MRPRLPNLEAFVTPEQRGEERVMVSISSGGELALVDISMLTSLGGRTS